MSYRSPAVAALCVLGVFAGSAAFARVPVTTDSCLARGLCAYVSPTGRVTCGKCPGQVVAISLPVGVTAVCKDGSFSRGRTAAAPLCRNRGGVGVRIRQ
jgi:hypothetical protein